MKFKQNVIIMFNSTCQNILSMWEQACQNIILVEYEPECTSGFDGTHSLESGHYYGRSLDFSLKEVPFELRWPLKHQAQDLLGADYLVLLEAGKNHYHIQRQKDSF